MKMILLLLSVSTVLGCSYRGSYDSIQASNRMQCRKLPPSQYDECMERFSTSYDDYERQRQESLKR